MINTKLGIHPQTLISFSGAYDNVEKCLAEFVDNSIDNAVEFLRDENLNFVRPIMVDVVFQGTNKKTSQVIVRDNCVGMSDKDLLSICKSIGRSKKRHGKFSNGQFGLGIFSFSQFFEKVTIQSMHEDASDAHEVTISMDTLSNDKEVVIKKISKNNYNNNGPGTVIILSHYTKRWSSVKKRKLEDFLNNHFERLLKDDELNIKIKDTNGEIVLKPFNYFNEEGESLIETSDGKNSPKIELYSQKTGQSKALISGTVTKNMKFHARLIKGRHHIEKPFFISIKGRRINDTMHAITGNSGLDPNIWRNPYLTGYFELGNFTQPDLSRTKIVSNNEKKSIVEYLLRKEDEIRDLLDERSKQNEDKNWKEAANQINDILADLTKEYNVEFSQMIQRGRDGDEGGINIRDGEPNPDPNPNPEPPSPGPIPSPDFDKGASDQDEEFDDDIDSKKRKSFLTIDFVDGECQTKNHRMTGEKVEIPSYMDEEGELVFFTKHPDFAKRVKTKRNGGSKVITQRLATFLGTRIGVHFLDKFFRKGNKGIIDYSIDQLEDNGDFILRFEDKMQLLIGSNLDSLGKNES